MWLKLCLLLVYILLLFILSRILEAISWSETSYTGVLSHQFLDPMVLSVSKLKALLEQRGVNYEGVVDKSELSSLVQTSGQISVEEAEMSQVENTSSETNFTSGAHFIEQVEDAKDSVWLVQVVTNSGNFRVMSGTRWKAVKEKASKFGIRTGFLDCSLDARYCIQKGWQSPFLLLALPSQFEKKASVAMYNYSGSVRETAVFRWLQDKLDEKIQRIEDPVLFQQQWHDFSSSTLEPEIRAVLFTKSTSAPLFYSALSVKFPGRVKFGLVSLKSSEVHIFWKHVLGKEEISNYPTYVTYFVEKNYTYGLRPGELYNFSSMEQFLKLLYPCLNDIFITSFCVANVLSWFELFISNCSIFRRFCKFIWCMFKYNIVVIMLWLPIIGIFQMPYLDRIPLLALKMARIFSTSYFGTVLRGDYNFYLNHPSCVILSFGMYLVIITFLCKKYRQVEQNDDNWFSFSQMRTATYLRPNDFFEPMRNSGYGLLGGLDVFSSHLSQPSLWLHPSISLEYIKHLPTWPYRPMPLATRAAENFEKMKTIMTTASVSVNSSISETKSKQEYTGECKCEKTAVFVRSTHASERGDQVLCCSSVQEAASSGAHGCNHSQKCFVSHKSPDSANHPIGKPCSELEEFSSLSNSEHSCLHCQSHHNNKTCNQSQMFLAHGKDHICQSETHNRTLSYETVTDRCATSLSTESFYTCSTHSESTKPTIDKNSRPPSTTPSSGCGFPTGYRESHQCVICLDDYVPDTMLCGLPCGHVFHETCIISWFNKEKHFCPMCRWPSYKLRTTPVRRSIVT